MIQNLNQYKATQSAAKQVLADLRGAIGPESTEESIAAFCANRLTELGFPDTWYYDCPAFVLAGDRSCLSISGCKYVPATVALGEHNLVTVDLSPCVGEIWGDCARSFAVENGLFTATPSDPEFKRGFDTLTALHSEMKKFVTKHTRFCDLFEFANGLIKSTGYVNLDFLGNVGHSIARAREDRVYIDADNTRKLSSTALFTFEPHIRAGNGSWGFKHENIFFFDAKGHLQEL